MLTAFIVIAIIGCVFAVPSPRRRRRLSSNIITIT